MGWAAEGREGVRSIGSGPRSGEWLYVSRYQQTGSFHLGLHNFGISIINFNPTTVLMLQLPGAYKQRIIIIFSTMRSKEWDISARSSAHSSRLQLLSEMQWMPVHLASIPCLVGLTQLITKNRERLVIACILAWYHTNNTLSERNHFNFWSWTTVDFMKQYVSANKHRLLRTSCWMSSLSFNVWEIVWPRCIEISDKFKSTW